MFTFNVVYKLNANCGVLTRLSETPERISMNSIFALKFVGSEVLTTITMKSLILWDTTPCSLLKFHLHFGWTYQRIYHARNQHGLCLLPTSCRFLVSIILPTWRRHVAPELLMTFNSLQGIIFQKIKLCTENWFFFYDGLFYAATSTSNDRASSGRAIDEWWIAKIWKELIVV
jgi:hypothetical protein